MSNNCFKFWSKKFLFALSNFSLVLGSINVTPFLPQSFFFDWNIPGQAVPIPITEQCETIHIVWSRGNAVGPNPTAPYFLQIYTSAYTVPFIISVGDVLSYDWTVPFAPGTLYQICMFDKFGNTGGCQATYTVIPPSSTPTCSNVTFPPPLGVTAVVDNGPMSQFGWVDQCTDISLTPTNGTAPYTLTVAPALHPPYNITSQIATAINWTVSLSWASPFFLSLVDARGNAWANGPLHSGGGGTIACLAGNVTSGPSSVKMAVSVGAGVGLGVGLAFALIAYFFLNKRFKRKVGSSRFLDLGSAPETPDALIFDQPQVTAGSDQYRPLPSSNSTGLGPNTASLLRRTGQNALQYQVEPFSMPGQDECRINNSISPTSIRTTHDNQGQVYVLHHDSNVPPVTIFHQEGTQIVELPPMYPPYSSSQSEANSEGRSGSDSRSDGTPRNEPLVLHQPRQPGQIQKPQHTP